MTFATLQRLLPKTAAVEDGTLSIGGVSLTNLAERYGTPTVVFDEEHLRTAARAWVDAFTSFAGTADVAYASKALPTTGIVQIMAEEGLGADVASGGELACALRAGIDPARIVVHGNNKSRAELAQAVEAGAGLVVIDAPDELELLNEVARDAGRTQRVLVRVNPDMVVETHRYIRTAHAGSKFGLDGDAALTVIETALRMPNVEPAGMHVHLGSQLLNLDPWESVIGWCAEFAARVRTVTGYLMELLDLGGGLGIAYTEDQHAPSVATLAQTIAGALDKTWTPTMGALPRLILEPGRSIVGPAAVTLYEVGVVKDAGDIRYVSVDGGMSDNLRPMLYQAEYRALLANRASEAPDGTWWVTGKHCESGDVLIEDAMLPTPVRGDLLAVCATGAYTYSMASNYNLVPRPAIVLVRDGSAREIVRRESIDDLFARDCSGETVSGRA